MTNKLVLGHGEETDEIMRSVPESLRHHALCTGLAFLANAADVQREPVR